VEYFGYLIVKKKNNVIDELSNILQAQSNSQYTNLGSNSFLGLFSRKIYKGIDRDRLMGFDEDVFTQSSAQDFLNTKNARVRMNKLLESKDDEALTNLQYPDDENCFNKLSDATEVFDLLIEKSKYEIIKIRRVNFDISDKTLGFDVGYWGDGNFSAIWNGFYGYTVAVTSGKMLDKTATCLEKLNQNFLFDTEDDAIKYRNWYNSQPWAEEDIPYDFEESAFSIIQVDKIIDSTT